MSLKLYLRQKDFKISNLKMSGLRTPDNDKLDLFKVTKEWS